jgi:hypothetical protein
MAKGMKIAKYDAAGEYGATQIDSQIGPQLVKWQNSTSTTTYTALGGVGGNPSVVAPRTIQVHYKTAAGVTKNDGYIVKQRGRKQFDVQSASDTDPARPTLTRITLVESGTLGAKQGYITFGYNGQGTQYAFKISNRYVWTNSSSPVRYQYTLGLSAEVAFHQTYSGLSNFVDYEDNSAVYPRLAVVEAQN